MLQLDTQRSNFINFVIIFRLQQEAIMEDHAQCHAVYAKAKKLIHRNSFS